MRGSKGNFKRARGEKGNVEGMRYSRGIKAGD